MSNVTNVIVLVNDWDDARLMKPFTAPSKLRRWSGELSCITETDADRYWVHDGKGPECHVWVGAFNHFNRKAFLEDVQGVPWARLIGVQVFILGQDDDCWGLWMFTDGKLREVQLPGVSRQRDKSETLENGKWIYIETGILAELPTPDERQSPAAPDQLR
jgi:hypothetical protein